MFHKIDLEGARAYVLAHSDEMTKARLEGILEGARPPRDLVKALEVGQNSDGGFARGWQARVARPDLDADAAPGAVPTAVPSLDGAPVSSLDVTCFLLDQFRDLPPLTGSPMASRALSFLRRLQNRDGSWSEEGAPFQGATSCGAKIALSSEVAPWLAGEEGTAYLTANVTFTLLTLDPSNQDPINWGLAWLGRYEGNAGLQPSFLAWAAACRHSGLDSALAVRYWESTTAALGDDDLDWLLSTALIAGVGGRYLLPIARMIETLAGKQQADGGWPGEDRVHATLQALRILRGFALI